VAAPVDLTNQNWLITPVASRPKAGGASSGPQLWLLVLTGLGNVSFSNPDSSPTGGWVSEVLTIAPDVQAPLYYAVNSPVGLPAGEKWGFDIILSAPFAAVSGVTSSDSTQISGGFTLDNWRPTPFIPDLVDSDGKPAQQVFQGINVQISVHSPSEILGLSYNIMLLGRIVRLGQPVVFQFTSGNSLDNADDLGEGS
jgi:hypothetical protein